jgi:NhaP-type Na+/H+ or K+/H+ antiporter
LDDALAMSLYAVGTSVSQLLLGDSISVSKAIFNVLFELTGAVGLGILAGLIIHFLIRHFLKKEKSLVFTLGILLILMGIAHRFDMDIILASMSCGIFLSNSSPKRSSIIFEVIKSFSAPIYVLFFALVGARLVFNQITIPICIIVGIYVLGRNFGKYTGTVAGGYITKADKNIVAYSGMGLFCQGGVAIGLSIVAGQHFTSLKIFDDLSLSDLIVSVITATTFFSQIIGPLLVKFTAKISGEIDKNITEDDILEKWKTEDVAITKIAKIKENEPVTKAISLFKDYNNLILPVIDNENKIKGSITLENLKDILTNPETWQWIVASDVATPITNIIQNKDNLKKVYEFMCETNISQIPIVKNEETLELSGILDVRHIKRSINNEIIKLKIT